MLENGQTTFVSSLEEYLTTQTEEPPGQTTNNEPLTSPTMRESSSSISERAKSEASSLSMVDAREESTREGGLIERHYETNETSATDGKNSKLDIVFTLPGATDNQNTEQGHTNKQETEASTPKTEHTRRHNDHHESNHNHHGESSTNKSKHTGPKQHWQVRGLLNVTHDYPLPYSEIIFGYIWPLAAALTLFTNLMIVFVLTQRDMRTPTNVVLTAIAIADIIPIVVPVPWFVYLFAMGNQKQVLYPPMVCYFYQHSTRSVSEIFYFLSTWLNVLLAIQDYLTACQPQLAKKYCQIKVVIVEIVSLTFLAFLLNLPQFLKLVYRPVEFYYNRQLTWGCKAMQARWFKDLVGEYVALYDDIFTAIIVLFVDGGPAIVLITLTSLLIRQLQRQRIQGHLLMEQARTASKRRRERHRQQEYESSARVMIFVLLAFLAVKIPFATTYTLMIIQSRFEIHFVENLVDFQKAITYTDLVFVLSYPLNFTIFCCCSKKFRHKCAQLLGECNDSTKLKRDRLMSFSNSFNSDSFISRRLSAALLGSHNDAPAGQQQQRPATRLHRESSVSFILEAGENNDHLANQKLQRQKFSMPELISKSSSRATTNNSAANSLAAMTPTHKGSEEALSGSTLSSPRPHQALSPRGNLGQPNRPGYSDCTTMNHFFGPSRSQLPLEDGIVLPTSPQFESMLENGSLCLDCVMCYERIKRSSFTADENGAPADGQTAVTQQQTHFATAASQVTRRSSQTSDSSFVWPPPAPPQPKSLANLQMQQQEQRLAGKGLPQIITTTCESISELHSAADDEEQPDEVHIAEGGGREQDEAKTIASRGKAARRQSNSLDQLMTQPQQQLGLSQDINHHNNSTQDNLNPNLSYQNSKLSLSTTNEMVTPPNWNQSQASTTGGGGETLSFCEVGQLRWEREERRQHHSSAHSKGKGGLEGSQHSSKSGEQVNEGVQVQRPRSRSRDNAFDSAGSMTRQGPYLAKPDESRAQVSISDPRDMHSCEPFYLQRQELEEFVAERKCLEDYDLAAQRKTEQHKRQKVASHRDDDEGSFSARDLCSSHTDLRSPQLSQADEDHQVDREQCPGQRTAISEQATKTTGQPVASNSKGGSGISRKLARHASRMGLGMMDNRQRSLSLSNSNLSTLPNATGMLADVLVSVLFVGKDGQSESGGGKSKSKGVKQKEAKKSKSNK